MITSPRRSLRDLLGSDYIDAVIRTAHAVSGTEESALAALADEAVDFYPPAFAERARELARRTGDSLVPPFADDLEGAPTDSYRRAQKTAAAPLGGLGPCRIGSDGRIYLAAKSEHYHLSLGHAFPGHRLLANAAALGIPNATHNNTRGHVTRLAERALVAAANGLGIQDAAAVDAVLSDRRPQVLNRVINLETGSLAAEAALKMMLAAFYEADGPGRGREDIPVFLVIADNDGGPAGNYHGTTIVAQTLRGMWPAFTRAAEEAGLYKVVGVQMNDIDDVRDKVARYSRDGYGIAGFCHEIVLMNYGGMLLDADFLREAHRLVQAAGGLVLCDEIQSCAWYPEALLTARLGLNPDLIAVGKGFPGGAYPASRIITTAAADRLSQFGALVTNGQEELASLAYLITMTFLAENRAHLETTGAHLHEGLRGLVAKHADLVSDVTGDGLMAGLEFHSPQAALRFCAVLESAHGIDSSVQAYKPAAPPTALLKLPVIVDSEIIDVIVDRMDAVLEGLRA
ncbi:aminotransferase class III-fold pyridoxal phosphate-dependent enzyme [Microbacterium sp. NPDC058342]|uniref:aminotransferase class III-fold pyridoxal phosphate-dependent enzyme n=1 Tax=Microbacterium sp. NPDC058342 TaxID=3346454 RepID=UPI00364F3971